MAATVDHRLWIDGERVETGTWSEVRSPYDGRLIGRVPRADAGLAKAAIESAEQIFLGDGFSRHACAEVLDRAARLAAAQVEDLAATISAEAGKPIKTARIEAARCEQTLIHSAIAARTLAGHEVPIAASADGADKLAISIRVPYGVVGAISPFNFPLNLVAHKLGPALAAGNTVVLKPAGQTPISALKLAEILHRAGLPAGRLQVVCGPGAEIGKAIVEDPRVGAISFTGSAAVGWGIRAGAAEKKVNLELGSNAPLIVMDDGDWERAADAASIHAFSHAGQSCISIQRILVHEPIAERFTARFVAATRALRVGDPAEPTCDVGPLISHKDRDRVLGWIGEASVSGAEVLCGGVLVDGDRCLAPTVIANPERSAKVWREEVFGPLATVSSVASLDAAIDAANDSRFGLQAGVFTRDLGRGLEAARRLQFGAVLINEVPTFRADQMPYGGVKDSGNTREGPHYAVRELTEQRLITLQAG